MSTRWSDEPEHAADSRDALTRREQEILRLMADDLSNAEIAERLVVAPGTIKWYAKQIYSKLDVHTRDEAVAAFQAIMPGTSDETHEPSLSTPHNLPALMTSLVGRQHEIRQIADLLRADHVRLLTLIGTPGIGKTRLSLETGARLLPDFPHGVYFIALAPLTDPGLIPEVILQTLDLPGGDDPRVTLKRELVRRTLLLICDNFEHVLSGASFIAELLAAAPGVKVLATSREPLRLYGEIEYSVPLLSLPERATPDSLSTSDAVRLFVQRAQAVRADFAITPENAAAIGQICAQLDGLPLAIELAAARMKLYTPHALLGRLSKRMNALTGGSRDLAPRHQTLRAAIAWSCELLSEDEMALFRAFGVFAGGCTMDAMASVCAGSADGDAFDLFESLVSKSLIQQQPGDFYEPRFTMLETIREYALEQLEQAGELHAIRARHADYFLGLAERADPLLNTPMGFELALRLVEDLDNFRAALDFLHVQPDRVADEYRMVVGLASMWLVDNLVPEGLARAQAALTRDRSSVPLEVQAGIHMLVGYGFGDLSRHAEAVSAYHTCLELAEAASSTRWKVYALAGIGMFTQESTVRRRDDYLREAIELAGTLNNPYLVLNLRLNYGVLVSWYDKESGHELTWENVRLARELNDDSSLDFALSALAVDLVQEGHYIEALGVAYESIEFSKRSRNNVGRFQSLLQIHTCEIELGLIDASAITAEEMIRLAEHMAYPDLLEKAYMRRAQTAISQNQLARARADIRYASQQAQLVDGGVENLFHLVRAARVLADLGDLPTAVRLFGAAASQGDRLAMPPEGYLLALSLRRIDHARAALGADQYEQYHAEGRALSLEQAFDLVIQALDD